MMLGHNGQSIRRGGGKGRRFLCKLDNMATKSNLHPAALAEAASLPPAVTARLLADADAIAGRMARRIASEIGRHSERGDLP